jgi:hypothetical protein
MKSGIAIAIASLWTSGRTFLPATKQSGKVPAREIVNCRINTQPHQGVGDRLREKMVLSLLVVTKLTRKIILKY